MINQLIENKEKPNTVKELSNKEINDLIKKEIPEFELDEVMDGLKKLAEASEILNKKVKLRLNKDINRIIITVIERGSNRILREIPCTELQNLAIHIKDAIGVILDTKA
jgi:flagellar protein FlaG